MNKWREKGRPFYTISLHNIEILSVASKCSECSKILTTGVKVTVYQLLVKADMLELTDAVWHNHWLFACLSHGLITWNPYQAEPWYLHLMHSPFTYTHADLYYIYVHIFWLLIPIYWVPTICYNLFSRNLRFTLVEAGSQIINKWALSKDR